MADFKTHLTGSMAIGIALGAAGYRYGIPGECCLLGTALCSVAGILPDLDSDGGVPFRISVNVMSVLVPLMLIQRCQHLGWDGKSIVWAAVLSYLVIRFGVAELFRRYTVHRGMWHSVPAAASMGLLTFLITDDQHLLLRGYWAGCTTIGFLTHLILDELSSVDFRGVRLKKSAGSALKFWTHTGTWPNVSAYGKLTILLLCVWSDPVWMVEPGQPRGSDLPSAARQAERSESPPGGPDDGARLR